MTNNKAIDVKLKRLQFDRNYTLPTSTIDVPIDIGVIMEALHHLCQKLPTPSCTFSMLAEALPKLTAIGSHTLFDL